MKELDVLFERFVHRTLSRLDDSEIDALERLVEHPDQDILEWIASASIEPPAAMHEIIELIRASAIGRP